MGYYAGAIVLIHESNLCRYAREARRKLCAQANDWVNNNKTIYSIISYKRDSVDGFGQILPFFYWTSVVSSWWRWKTIPARLPGPTTFRAKW